MPAPTAVVWQPLLEAARRTPSPHNVQPWRVRLRSTEEADLLIDGARVLPREDVTGAFLLSTMGMYQEALSIAARATGMALESAPLETPTRLAEQIARARIGDLLPLARLRLRAAGSPTPDELRTFDLMATRRTSRLGYDARPVPWSAYLPLAALAALAAASGLRRSGGKPRERCGTLFARSSPAAGGCCSTVSRSARGRPACAYRSRLPIAAF